MRMTITATVTYLVDDVSTFREATSILHQLVSSEARHMDGTQYLGVSNIKTVLLDNEEEYA